MTATNPKTVFDNRLVSYASVLLIAGYGFLFSGELAHGYTLFGYKELAIHDFSVFWGAGRLVVSGKAASVYDWRTIHDLLTASLGKPSSEYVTTFYYPPWFLIALAPLGMFPFAWAAGIWILAALVFYLAAMRSILPGTATLIVALAAPTVFFNVFTGQDGLLTASLFGGALALLDAVPVAAGILIGLIAYKPHFGILLPLFLAVTGRWRVFGAAAATVIGVAGFAVGLFGNEVFIAFAQALPTAGDAYLRHGHLTGQDWQQLASLYGLLHVIGLDSSAAWGAHLAIAIMAAGALLWVAGSGARADLKAASLAVVCVIVTPYSELNDLAILNVAIALLLRDGLRHGLRRSESAALAAAYLVPLLYLLAIAMRWRDPGHLTWLIGPLMQAIIVCVIAGRVIGSVSRGAYRRCIQPAGVSE